VSERSRLLEAVLDVLQTGFRMAPWPTEPGLRAVGHPGELSPVIVTCNYDLTVRRVVRALDGVDAWLVVAPSQGINVWCAASGGHFGTHQVVTALKTSGVAERVRHRRAILPQLAATGVRAREVSRRCGWRTHFGPVYAEDLPRYLAGGNEKTEDMRRVRFGMRRCCIRPSRCRSRPSPCCSRWPSSPATTGSPARAAGSSPLARRSYRSSWRPALVPARRGSRRQHSPPSSSRWS